MQPQANVLDCYNKTAQNYADKYGDELNHKHLDRILLQAFGVENKTRGRLIDLGCGPGQTTAFLHACGVPDLLGTDLSPEMVRVAKNCHPHLAFEVADMLALPYSSDFFGSAIAFYAIVHFDYQQVATAFREINRVLQKDGQFLFSFHIGNEVVHTDVFLDHPVNVDFHFLEPDNIIRLLAETGFSIIDAIERAPYEGVEYASRRAYIWAKKA